MEFQEEYERNSLRFGVKTAKLTARGLAYAAAFLLKCLKNRQPKGIISIKKLMKDGDKLLSSEVKNADLKELSKVMKRYNIGIAVMQHGDTGDYTIFFKSKNEHQLEAALNDYLAKVFNREHPNKELPKDQAAKEAVIVESMLSLDAGRETPLLESPSQTPLLEEPAPYLTIGPGRTPMQPIIDVSFKEVTEVKEKQLVKPLPLSIPKKLEAAKMKSQALEAAHQTKKGIRELDHMIDRGRSR